MVSRRLAPMRTLTEGYEELLSWFGISRGALVLTAITGSLTTLFVTCLTALLLSP